jgi:hypothetical protein
VTTPAFQLSTFHLDRADRAALYDRHMFGKLAVRTPPVEVHRTREGWLIDFSNGIDQVGFLEGNIPTLANMTIAHGATVLALGEAAAVRADLPIFNPHTDEIVPFDGFTGVFDAPDFDFLLERALGQMEKYPQFHAGVFEGWAVGRAAIDFETKGGLAILRGDYTLVQETDEEEHFWSFELAVKVAAYIGTIDLVPDQSPRPAVKAPSSR